MTSALANITFDCTDAAALAGFWSAVLDRPVDPDGSVHFASIGMGDATATSWLFGGVPEGKTAKNRMHVDLVAPDRDAEVTRLVGLGATHLRDVAEHGHAWAVLRDPEGNEFCVAQQPSE
ncbi:VOC family protein [Pseudonocardia sp. TRM90224]|uniref:VOC family protein n=1 Tax=Pseudonocardia sp. TRM90224 TaxID=2812678 RepID=UPI001E326F1C|nr:VOC family protein [Pseudonocardia sp. TRM90224]